MLQTSGQPLIVQSDSTVLAEVNAPGFDEARMQLARFAELVKSPEHIQTYRISPLSIWNAAAAGLSLDDIRGALVRYSKYAVPENILAEIEHTYARYGVVKLQPWAEPTRLILEIHDAFLRQQLSRDPGLSSMLQEKIDEHSFAIWAKDRGRLKQSLIKIGYPVVDLAGYVNGDPCRIDLRSTTKSGLPFTLRDYQIKAADTFYQAGSSRGGSGVIVLPCGAGKTVVGMAVMSKLGAQTLIICTSLAAVHQWIDEILDKTLLTSEQVGEYSSDAKQLRPVTVATYNILTHMKPGAAAYDHFDLFNAANWGLIIYDEAHLLPAPLFRMTAEIQARRRLGLTATLIREDGLEDDVFSLVGPKRYETPWKELETKGWIAQAVCHELRVPLSEEDKYRYAVAESRARFRIAAENRNKAPIARQLLQKHAGEPTLIIGQYVDQLKKIAAELDLPLITGQTANAKREKLYSQLRAGALPALVVSKVANFSIDLPDARVLIEISGAFGSRQEEAQRLGRILRPKKDGATATFYTLVSHHTSEQEFARHRQLFLTEQGYKYQIEVCAAPAPDILGDLGKRAG
ncbi:MAG TPA: DNA repair helicase XPB [Elusimicrobiota bacterium]|nr:DNA repair helicase XPB [Elusimicrobiota bacterium]